MKSIVYLTDRGDRRNIPRFVEHDPCFPAFEIYKRTARWLSNAEAHLRYCICIETGWGGHGVHQKINRRAEYIGRTSLTGHAGQADIYTSDSRTAKARYRNARRRQRRDPGYACIDIAFGIIANGDYFNFTETEHCHIRERQALAATSRAPLPPWRLCDCWPENATQPTAA